LQKQYFVGRKNQKRAGYEIKEVTM